MNKNQMKHNFNCMKQFTSICLSLIGLLVLASSCNNRKTYADYLKDEKRAIDLFISKNDLVILKNFPSDGVFGDKEFYKDPATGVYYSIIEPGDTTRPKMREKVYIRFKGLQYLKSSDTIRYSNYHTVYPEELEYFGPVNNMTRSYYSTPGWAVPLTHVGHKGKVKMIVPFEVGLPADQSQFEPTYYDQLEYRFENQW